MDNYCTNLSHRGAEREGSVSDMRSLPKMAVPQWHCDYVMTFVLSVSFEIWDIKVLTFQLAKLLKY